MKSNILAVSLEHQLKHLRWNMIKTAFFTDITPHTDFFKANIHSWALSQHAFLNQVLFISLLSPQWAFMDHFLLTKPTIVHSSPFLGDLVCMFLQRNSLRCGCFHWNRRFRKSKQLPGTLFGLLCNSVCQLEEVRWKSAPPIECETTCFIFSLRCGRKQQHSRSRNTRLLWSRFSAAQFALIGRCHKWNSRRGKQNKETPTS